MKRARDPALVAHAAGCRVCGDVAKVARRTGDAPTLSTYLLLEQFAACPEAGRAYCYAALVGEDGSDSDDTTDALPLPVVPWGALLTAWSAADIAALQARFTPHSNAKNKLPSQARVRTDFTRTKHDYYIDGVLCHAGTGWYSPSGLMKKLWKPFDAQGVAMRLSAGSNPKYAGRPWQDICADWNANRDSGSAKHHAYDKWLQHEPLETHDAQENPILPPPVGFYRAMASLADRFDVWQTEAELFDERTKAYGVADLVLVERATGTLYIADFKNCKDEDLGAAGHGSDAGGTHPWSAAMPDTKLAHYRFQLSYYRWLLVRLLAADGRAATSTVSTAMILLNFRPDEPEAFYRYDLEALPTMDELMAHMPWDEHDPWHRPPAPTPLVPGVTDADLAAAAAVETRRLVGMPPKGPLPLDVVWTGKAYCKNGYELPDSPWKAQEHWFGPPPAHIPSHYEQYLRGARALLVALPLLVGKRLACWCREEQQRCHADVLVRYANATVRHRPFLVALMALRGSTADEAFIAWHEAGVPSDVLDAMAALYETEACD